MYNHPINVTILQACHFICYLYRGILIPFFIWIYYQVQNVIEQVNGTSDYVGQTNIRIPKHIALTFTNELDKLDLNSIARTICWCKQLGIEIITLYDDIGCLKDQEKPLIKCFEKKFRQMGYEKPIDRIDGLKILSKSDGRPKFVAHVKKLVKLNPESINLDRVQEQVSWNTDPDMLISFGYHLCLHGFPPWQLRLTEIFSIPTHRRLPQRIFIDCLRQYSRTVQRVGV